MSIARTHSATPWGIDAHPVLIEVDARTRGIPSTHIVGLPDTAVRESKERVTSAITHSGIKLEPRRPVIVNLAPADLRKEGNHLDVAIAMAMIAAYDELDPEALAGRRFCGELGLDGRVRPIRGALSIADLARRQGDEELFVPAANAGEAAAIPGITVRPVETLADVLAHVRGGAALPEAAPGGVDRSTRGPAPDLAEVRGQHAARRALEIAAAGGHNLVYIGPPGSGKTMLARRLPGILPPLTPAEALEVTKIHSLVAAVPASGLCVERPFRSPHHGISSAGLIGGGRVPRPGEATLAHGGVLFLDELPEFQRYSLESLRQPLEEGRVTVVRARARATFPARFSLVAAMNPCPCGHLGDPRHVCRCAPPLIDRYRGRISGPLLDRIDLHVEVPAPSLAELRAGSGETTMAVAARVLEARERQIRRFRDDGAEGAEAGSFPCNAALPPDRLERHAPLEPTARKLLDRAFESLGLSARAMSRVLKVARTLADLDGSEKLRTDHVAEAVQYRSLDRRNGV